MSLFADKALSFSPQLAATIGLEAAVLLGVLADVARYRDTSGWVVLRSQQLESWLPFWPAQDIQRISQSLAGMGLINLRGAPYLSSQILEFQLTAESVAAAPAQPIVQPQPVAQVQPMAASMAPVNSPLLAAPQRAQPAQTPAFQSAAGLNAQLLASEWQPDAECLRMLAQMGIERDFALSLLPEFVSYWRQKRVAHYAWGNRFLKHAIKRWRDHQLQQAKIEQSSAIVSTWRPHEDAMAIMLRDGIDRQFIENCIAEFILYWRGRGEHSSTWDSKFLQHVRHQWASYTATLGHDSTPRLMSPNWQPSADAYDILQMAAIDLQFAREMVPEFVLYWLEAKQAHASWNTKFITHVKYRWARRHDQAWQGETDGFVATHTDNSWASEL